MLELGSHALRDLARSVYGEKQIHGDVGTLWYKNWAFANFSRFLSMLSFTARLYAFDCTLLTAGLHSQQFWSIQHQSHHLDPFCTLYGDWWWRSIHWNVLKLQCRIQCNCASTAYQISTYAPKISARERPTSQTCAAFSIFQRRATVLVTLRNQRKTKVLPRKPTASKKNQTKKKHRTVSRFLKKCGVLLRTFRPCSPGFTNPVGGQSLHGSAAWRRKLPPRRRPAVC